MGKQSVSAWQSIKTFSKFKTSINFNQVASSPSIRSIKSSIAIFVNIYFWFSPKDYAEPKPYIIYMYIYVTEHSEKTRAELTQAELTQGRVDSGADLTSGRVDSLPSLPHQDDW